MVLLIRQQQNLKSNHHSFLNDFDLQCKHKNKSDVYIVQVMLSKPNINLFVKPYKVVI